MHGTRQEASPRADNTRQKTAPRTDGAWQEAAPRVSTARQETVPRVGDARQKTAPRAGAARKKTAPRVNTARQALAPRTWLALLGIAVSAFVFNSSEFMPMALLTDIGASFGTDEATTGAIVTVYAWAVMLLSVPLMMLATRVPFKPLFLVVLAVFAVGQLLCGLAPGYGMLLAARLVLACAHAIFWAVSAPPAARLVDKEHRALAVTLVTMGTALAMVAGVPLGRVVGLALGWRQAFLCMAGAAVAILAFLVVVFPPLSGAAVFQVRRLPQLVKNAPLRSIFVVTALYTMGAYTAYSYIEPFFLQAAGVGEDLVTALLAFFGVAGVAGSGLCSCLYSPRSVAFLCAPIACATGAMALLLPVSSVLPAGPFVICALWGAASSVYDIVYQTKIIEVCAPDEQTVATAAFSGIFNFGIGTGSFVGGLVCAHDTVAHVGFAGAAIACAALLYAVTVFAGRLRGRG